MKEKLTAGTLYLVATPIGNLADISLRALAILAQVEAIYCEDTRRTRVLLQQHGIRSGGKLLSCPQFEQARHRDAIVHRLRRGEAVAYVADAGTPGLSDPGAQLAAAVWEAGLQVRALPGASALLSALSLCGWEMNNFCFLGFLPRQNQARLKLLEQFAPLPQALVFYEAPHRIAASLQAVVAVFGAKAQVCLTRELTKMHESVVHAPAGELLDNEQIRNPKGEYTVIIAERALKPDAQLERNLDILAAELPLKQAASIGAKLSGASRAHCYNYLLAKSKADHFP